MIPYAKIEGGSPGAASGMTDHLWNNTVSQEQAILAAYYGRGAVRDELLLDTAHALAVGSIDLEAAIQLLITDWEKIHPEPDAKAFGAAVAAQYPHGIPPDVPDPYDAFDARHEAWREARFEAEGRLTNRVDALADKIANGLLDAPLAVVRPDIHPAVAKGLGIQPDALLSKDEISHLLAGYRTDGERIEGKSYAKERDLPPDEKTGEERTSKPLGSMDFVPSPHKSVSVAWGFAGPLEQAKILNAHTEATREAMAHIADHIGQARIGAGGKDGAVKGSVGWLEFTHHTARPVRMAIKDGVATFEPDMTVAADPDIHTHFPVMNAVFCSDGRVGSLDTQKLRGLIFEADSLYHARLGDKLRVAGFDVVRDERTGSARMLAIPEYANSHFSKRTNAGEAYAKIQAARRGGRLGRTLTRTAVRAHP